jgi:MarR family transcriptional regulator, 2-MHQ and catechol-resistance regulon repressor
MSSLRLDDRVRQKTDPSDAETAALHAALTDLIRVYQFRDRDRICCHNLSVSQFYGLASLIEHGKLTLNGLAAELYLEKSSASRLVDGLVAKGYATRGPHPDDRRATLLAPTAAGRRIHARIVRETMAEERRVLADFVPPVRAAMAELLGRLARAAQARVAAAGGSCCRVAD